MKIIDFKLLHCICDNHQEGRLSYKIKFCIALQKKCEELLLEGRNVIIVGDFNVAHQEIDISSKKVLMYSQYRINISIRH